MFRKYLILFLSSVSVFGCSSAPGPSNEPENRSHYESMLNQKCSIEINLLGLDNKSMIQPLSTSLKQIPDDDVTIYSEKEGIIIVNGSGVSCAEFALKLFRNPIQFKGLSIKKM